MLALRLASADSQAHLLYITLHTPCAFIALSAADLLFALFDKCLRRFSVRKWVWMEAFSTRQWVGGWIGIWGRRRKNEEGWKKSCPPNSFQALSSDPLVHLTNNTSFSSLPHFPFQNNLSHALSKETFVCEQAEWKLDSIKCSVVTDVHCPHPCWSWSDCITGVNIFI